MEQNNSKERSVTQKIINNQKGKIGYLVAWMLGVPASLLLVIFLLRGG